MCHTFVSCATCFRPYVLCSTPFPLPYLLSLKHYFVYVYISLLYIWWSWKGPWFKSYTLLYIYKVYFTELYYKHVIYKVIFTNIPKLSFSLELLLQSQGLNPNPIDLNTKYYVKTNAPTFAPTFAPTLGAFFHAPTFI